MILYKYATTETALLMLQHGTITFSNGNTFNDPTELSSAHYTGELQYPHGGIGRWPFLNSFGICCLTRAPLNPIMWAHYGEKHRGVVIGIDANEAGLNATDTCVIPAKYGSLIYTGSKPQHPYIGSEAPEVMRGEIQQFDPLHLEALQRAFLHKSSEWAYEEEVRVVRSGRYLEESGAKLERDSNGDFTGRYFASIRKESIKSVHLGTRWLALNSEEDKRRLEQIREHVPHANIEIAYFDDSTWKMNSAVLWSQNGQGVFNTDMREKTINQLNQSDLKLHS
ncbi:DUF2971 domain-containing protein [Herbaspirillum sp. C9C3]|uniref:DUF2971 domain-containing protein n=1 Tax=Herbaspirillum sp. C9C3 TaxID=2735271 RepID=UPI0015848E8B|nr:DUF2971 domain-containing protein [Herbaspirillum sp. C9C3]NUT60142.1 DUF2971 domain-containing protein [Herbaspirillum sp. C9C3]